MTPAPQRPPVKQLRSVYIKCVPCGHPDCLAKNDHGDAVALFADGHEEQLSTGGISSLAQAYPTLNRAGWTVGTHYHGPNGVKFHNSVLVIWTAGARSRQFHAERPIIESWGITGAGGGEYVATFSRASHGPASAELFDFGAGERVQKLQERDITAKSPSWAQAFVTIKTPLDKGTGLPDGESPVHVPQPGTAERGAIMDAARAEFYGGRIEAAHRNDRKITFKVWFMRAHGNWALTSVEPLDASGKPTAEPRWLLFRRAGLQWVDMHYFDALRPYDSEIAAEDALNMTVTTIKQLLGRFPDAPRDIFPDSRGQPR